MSTAAALCAATAAYAAAHNATQVSTGGFSDDEGPPRLKKRSATSPWLRRAIILAIIGLWLWLPVSYQRPQRSPVPDAGFSPAAGLAPGKVELLLKPEQLNDEALWAELEKMDEFELRDEYDSLLFKGTAAQLRLLVAGEPSGPARGADEPLLPTTGGE